MNPTDRPAALKRTTTPVFVPRSAESREAIRQQEAADRLRLAVAKEAGAGAYRNGVARDEMVQRIQIAELELDGWNAARLDDSLEPISS